MNGGSGKEKSIRLDVIKASCKPGKIKERTPYRSFIFPSETLFSNLK